MKYILIILFFVSCSSAEKLTYKAMSKDKAKVAEITRKEWPCTTTNIDTAYKIDTLYDLIEVQCPDTIRYIVDSFETVTAVRVPVYIKVPIASPIQTITVTKTIEDSAKIFIINTQLKDCNEDLVKAQNKVHKMGKVIMWLIFIIIGFSIPYIIKLIKFIK